MWPFSQLVVKAPNINTLKMIGLGGTIPHNVSLFMCLVGELCSQSDSCLETLQLKFTGSTAEDGAKLWQTLSEASTIASLKEINIASEKPWFSITGQSEVVSHLATVLRR